MTALAIVFGTATLGHGQVVYSGDDTLPPNVIIGNTGTGSLLIKNGGAVSSTSSIIGNLLGSSGSVLVDGTGSTWTNSGDLDLAYFDGTGSLGITNGGSVSSANGNIGNGIVTVDGSHSSWINSASLSFGYFGGNASVSITNGGFVSSFGAVIGDVIGQGNVTVDGAGSSLKISTGGPYGGLVVGNLGDGTLAITHGGSVISPGVIIGLSNEGSVTVDGVGSTWDSGGFDIGAGDLGGSLTITNGGSVTSSDATVGDNTDGMVIVDGAGSLWKTGNLDVGSGGAAATAELIISDGGRVISTGAGISNSFYGASVVVDGTGSTWSNSGDLIVSEQGGNGTIAITHGGSVSDVNAYIGDGAFNSFGFSNTGTVTVDGAGSNWSNSRDLFVGYSGAAGSLVITDGGFVSNRNSYIGNGTGSSGKVAVDGAGSTWSNSGTLTVGGDGGSGSLIITNGGAVNARQVSILQNGGIQVDGRLDPTSIDIFTGGTLSGTGSIIGDISNSGKVILGDTASNPGTLSEVGSYIQNGGTLLEGIESATHYGTFDVSGNITLGGSLDINLLNGFDPTSGEIFDLINYTGTETGAFSPITGWLVLYDPNGNQQVDLEFQTVPDASNSGLLLIAGIASIIVASRLRQKRS